MSVVGFKKNVHLFYPQREKIADIKFQAELVYTVGKKKTNNGNAGKFIAEM